MSDLRRWMNAVAPLTEADDVGVFQMWHGSRRWDGSPEVRPPKAGRYEAGPGIYLTTNYMTASKYAKGGGSTFLVDVDRGVRLADQVQIPLTDALAFVKSAPRMRQKAAIAADLQRNTARRNADSVMATVLINLTVNYEAGAGMTGIALTQFLRQHGVDASLEPQSAEDWLVVINPKVIRSMQRMPAKDVSVEMYHLPQVPR